MKIPERALLPIAFGLGFTVGLLVLWGVMLSNSKQVTALPSPAGYYPPPSPVQVPVLPTPEHVTDTVIANGQWTYTTSTPIVDDRRMTLSIAWLENPTEVLSEDAERLFAPLKLPKGAISDKWWNNTTWEGFRSMWKMGKVKSGEFAGMDLYLFSTIVDGLGSVTSYGFALFPEDGSLPRLIGGSDMIYIADRMINMPNARIDERVPGLTLTLSSGRKIELADKRFPFYSGALYTFIDFSNATLTKEGTSQEGFDLYKNEDGVPGYVILDDGEVYEYGSRLPGKEVDTGFLPDITWSSGAKNTDVYATFSGCGGKSSFPRVLSADEEKTMGALTVIGRTSEGDAVYFPKEPNTNPFVQAAYDMWFLPEGKEKLGINEFLKKYPHPMFFWKNAFGDWSESSHADLQPQAECGKPVIYLYPEKTSRVSVRLPSFINVTVSEPLYPADGWNVVAHPDGSLEYADGKTYGSLYWEGTGVGYDVPKEGFLLKDGTVDARLSDILAKYGLNATESREFREFWVPKMTGAKYYRVSFLTSEWSKAAPLNVSPRPTTAIRIFMDWQKLNAPMSIAEPKIVTPERNGFTLVEWGGLLR